MRPVLWAGLVLAGALAIKGANAQIAVQNQGYVPYSEAPIHYRTRPLNDPVALLQKDLDRGAAHLTYDERHGYLRSVLKVLRLARQRRVPCAVAAGIHLADRASVGAKAGGGRSRAARQTGA